MDFGPPEALLRELHLEAILDAGFHRHTQAALQCLAHIDRFYLEFPQKKLYHQLKSNLV